MDQLKKTLYLLQLELLQLLPSSVWFLQHPSPVFYFVTVYVLSESELGYLWEWVHTHKQKTVYFEMLLMKLSCKKSSSVREAELDPTYSHTVYTQYAYFS